MLLDTNTVLFTGLPRSGTTLCCFLLNRFENTVALHEPIDPASFDVPDISPLDVIGEFVTSSRKLALADKFIQSKQRDGAVPDNPVSTENDGVREESVVLGKVAIEKALTLDFTLVVKHNALFTALGRQLTKKYRLYALVRNPLPVLASWRSINLPVGIGRLPMGEKFDAGLRQALEVEDDVLKRQLTILRWFFDQYRAFDSQCLLTYEELVRTNGNLLAKICKSKRIESGEVKAQYKNSSLSRPELEYLSSMLVERADIFEGFYSTDDVRYALEQML